VVLGVLAALNRILATEQPAQSCGVCQRRANRSHRSRFGPNSAA